MKTKSMIPTIFKFFKYNLTLIFAHRFKYFLIAALLTFILIAVLIILDSETLPDPATIYGLLYLPGILLIFYPCVYGIQMDQDARMVETIFGIPDYRYKVWLIRLIITFLVVMGLMFGITGISHFILAPVPVVKMVLQLMFPLIFIGCVGFMLATLTRSGHGAAGILISFGFFNWIGISLVQGTKWNVFHNPFIQNPDLSALVWAEITFYNRIILLAGAGLSLLFGLLNLQQREKFI